MVTGTMTIRWEGGFLERDLLYVCVRTIENKTGGITNTPAIVCTFV